MFNTNNKKITKCFINNVWRSNRSNNRGGMRNNKKRNIKNNNYFPIFYQKGL